MSKICKVGRKINKAHGKKDGRWITSKLEKWEEIFLECFRFGRELRKKKERKGKIR